MPNEVVRLVVGGRSRDEWSGLSLDSDLLIPADDFSLTLDALKTGYMAEIHGGDPCQVYVAGELVLTGKIDQVRPVVSKRSRGLTVTGRDLAGGLVDCSLLPREWDEADLARIAGDVCPPLGVAGVRVQGATLTPFEHEQVNPGETPWALLSRLAEKQKLGLWLDVDGTLVIGRPTATSSSKRLYHSTNPRRAGRNNVARLELVEDMSRRFSEVVALGQDQADDTTYATDKSEIENQTVRDEELVRRGVHRPLVIVDPDIEDAAQATERARYELNRGKLAGWQLRAVVAGHTQNGRVWRPGELVRVDCDDLGLAGDYLLTGRELRFDRQDGRTTELRLALPGVWP